MPRNFSTIIDFEKKQLPAVFVPEARQDGLYYEVNIKGYPRFFMRWSELGRFDILEEYADLISYELVLAASDVLEKRKG